MLWNKDAIIHIPFGFGESGINTGNVQLPFALVLLVFGPTSGFIISKLGSLRPMTIGTISALQDSLVFSCYIKRN
jgi:uncharacterized membrane protein